MSQIVVCRNRRGIVLAADSGSLEVAADGSLCIQSVQRLHQLSDFAAVVAGGGRECAVIARELKAFIAAENLQGFEEVLPAALPFLASAFEDYMRTECAQLPVDPLHHIYFVLAGYSTTDGSFGAFLAWNKKRRPLLDSDAIASAFAVPRRLGLEVRLNRMAAADQSPDMVLETVRRELERPDFGGEDFSPPLVFATVTRDGFAFQP
jgi:hypothetical protein